MARLAGRLLLFLAALVVALFFIGNAVIGLFLRSNECTTDRQRVRELERVALVVVEAVVDRLEGDRAHVIELPPETDCSTGKTRVVYQISGPSSGVVKEVVEAELRSSDWRPGTLDGLDVLTSATPVGDISAWTIDLSDRKVEIYFV